MRRLLIPFALLGCLLAAAPTTPASAASTRQHVDVIKVNGLIDPVLADFVEHSISSAEESGAAAVVMQVDSRGGVVSDGRIDVLAFKIAHSKVPVTAWVGQSGANAFGAAYRLVEAAAVRGVAPGSHVGKAPRRVFGGAESLAGRSVGAGEARRLGIADVSAPTLGDFLVELDGRTVGSTTLHTAEVVTAAGQQRRRPTVDVRFSQLGLWPRLLHTAASPSAAYVLLVLGMALVVFELFTAGVGVAAVTGALFLVLASYGLAALPTRPIGVALLVVGVIGYAIDVQAGAPRAWTVIGTVAMATGSVLLYHGLSPSLFVMALVVAGVALFMVAGMPAMVRARFSTPTIGRESMVGELGQALAAVAPEGTVEVRGAPWRARTNRATPIAAGDAVRVVAIDGLLLEVEPESGGARDYRE